MLASIDAQNIIRMNRDTLYSAVVVDLDAGPVTITLPDPGKRFMSLQIVDEDIIFNSHQTRLVELAERGRLPAAYGVRESVAAGGLMSYGPSFLDFYRRSAAYVDKILKGDKPADLPVEQPTKFELVINLQTAKTLGLTIPPSLLSLADEVIE